LQSCFDTVLVCELYVGKALADASLCITNNTHILDLAALAELLPKTLLDVRGDLLLLALLRLNALALIVDERKVTNEDARAGGG
jgi:hypothetical protein